MTETQKRQFLYGDLPAVGVIGAVLAVVFVYAALESGDMNFGLVLLALLVVSGVAILGIFYLICWLNIRRSQRRHWSRSFQS